VFLPAVRDSRTAEAAQPQRKRPRGGKETILLAEDDASLRFLSRVLLERQGYTVFEAGDADEAIKVWKERSARIDLLFTDMVMPGGFTGQQLAAQLRAEKPSLKVIYTSGYSAEFAGRQIQLREGDNFLQKPTAPDQILETVRRCLDASAQG
jgi:DNA-binding NtrC family response regulator